MIWDLYENIDFIFMHGMSYVPHQPSSPNRLKLMCLSVHNYSCTNDEKKSDDCLIVYYLS